MPTPPLCRHPPATRRWSFFSFTQMTGWPSRLRFCPNELIRSFTALKRHLSRPSGRRKTAESQKKMSKAQERKTTHPRQITETHCTQACPISETLSPPYLLNPPTWSVDRTMVPLAHQLKVKLRNTATRACPTWEMGLKRFPTIRLAEEALAWAALAPGSPRAAFH